MSWINKYIVLSLIVTIFYLIGLLVFIPDYEENKCDMTYMFEYPQFVKINTPIQDQYSRYGLYAYSEGKLTERARAMKFSGIPVLFVPGNAGSYKQVRSLASVALRKSLNSRPGYHFDFFTLNLNKELPGLNGAVLEDQKTFLNYSLHRILELYNENKPPKVPTNVIVIGHSMGGVIAHSLLNSSDKINLLITLASPHRRPVISFDKYIVDFYTQLPQNVVTSDNHNESRTVISIGGGFQDHLVNSWLTNSPVSTLNVIANTIPKVWLSTDHKCIIWCKQLVLVIVRALFDCVDLKTNQLSNSHKYRTAVFKQHLRENSGINMRWADRYKVIVRFDSRGVWKEDIRRLYTISMPKGTENTQWIMIRIVDDPKHEALFLQAINFEFTDWIFACTADNIRGDSRYCENGIHLTHLSKIVPSNKFKRRIYYTNLFRLKRHYPKITHVVARILPTSEPISLIVDIHNPKDRIVNVRWYFTSQQTIIQETAPNTVRYELELSGLLYVIQAFILTVEPIKCLDKSHHATATFSVPWSNYELHHIITETSKKSMLLRLINSRPLYQNNLTAKVFLTLDPTCQYSVSIRNSYLGILGQFARFYSPLLIANIAAIILISFRYQLTCVKKQQRFPSFPEALCLSTKPYYSLPAVKLLSKFLISVQLLKFLPVPDAQIITKENLDFLMLPIILFMISGGLIYILSLILWYLIIMNEATVFKLFEKVFFPAFGKLFRFSDWTRKIIHQIPSVLEVIICLGIITSEALIVVLVLYYFLKITHMCEDFKEDFVKNLVMKLIKKILKKILRIKEQEPEPISKDTLNEKQFNELNEPTNNLQEEKTLEICKEVPETKAKDDDDIEEKRNDLEVNDDEQKKLNVALKADSNLEELNADNSDSENENQSKNENKSPVSDITLKSSTIHFHYTMFLILCFIACLNIPAILTWAHNYQYNYGMNNNSSYMFGVILSVFTLQLWQIQELNMNKKYLVELGYFIYGLAIIILIYAPINIYRITYIMTLAFAATICLLYFSPDDTEETNNDSTDTDNILRDLKDKME